MSFGSINDDPIRFDDGWSHESSFKPNTKSFRTNSFKYIEEDIYHKIIENINFSSAFEELLTEANKYSNRPFAKPIDPTVRLKEIDHELDIIRGRVETPKGYSITPDKVKILLAERKQLVK